MKNYEDKYKEALERAKLSYHTGDYDKDTLDMLELIFPELKENEDEKIRKEIISHLQYLAKYCNESMPNVDKWVAWLEKQGEQKVSVVDFKEKDWYVSKVDGKIYNAKFMEKTPTNQARKLEIEKAAMSATGIIEQEEWFIKGAEWSDKNPSYISSEKQGEKPKQDNSAVKDCNNIDPYFGKPTYKVEPKFHKGEWITNGDYTWKIVEVKPLDYILQSQDGNIVDDTISHVDEQFHSFTIVDAKKGDVLFYRGNVKYSDGIKFDRILLFENLDTSFFVLTKYSNGVEDYGINENIDYPDNVILATKEQKEILFMVMKEAGYEWDAQNKEPKNQIKKNLQDNSFRRMFEQ